MGLAAHISVNHYQRIMALSERSESTDILMRNETPRCGRCSQYRRDLVQKHKNTYLQTRGINLHESHS